MNSSSWKDSRLSWRQSLSEELSTVFLEKQCVESAIDCEIELGGTRVD